MIDILFRPFCWAKKVWDIFRSSGNHATGHRFIETPESGKIARILILRCEICGQFSIGWEVQ